VANVDNGIGRELRDSLNLLLFIIKLMIIEIIQMFIKVMRDVSRAKGLFLQDVALYNIRK
jgi:hypothetical protein